MTKQKVNLFDVIPSLSEHITTEKEGDLSVITFPRFPNRFIQKYLAPFTKSKLVYIRLDEYGTAVWNMIDGKRTVDEICNRLADYFEHNENYKHQISTFISQLRANGFVKYKMPV